MTALNHVITSIIKIFRHPFKLCCQVSQALTRSFGGFGAAHALSGQTEDSHGRDKKYQVVKLSSKLECLMNGRLGASYSRAGVLVLLDLRPGLDEEASQVGKISL